MDALNPIISIIFPSFNGEAFLTQNLESIKELSNLNEIELIIVDNNSSDSSIKIIKSYNKDINLKIIESKKNLGFSKACNIAVSYSKGTFIFITNQDVIFPSDYFKKLLDLYYKFKNKKEIIISTAIIFKNNKIYYFGAKIHILGFSYTSQVFQILSNEKIITTTQRFSGCSLFLRKELFQNIGGFDPNFFMYYEDTDLSLRFLRKGLKIYITNEPKLIHLRHSLHLSDFRYYLLERNRYISFSKNIDGFKKLIPFFIIFEMILLFQSLLIRKFKLRIRVYYDLLSKTRSIINLRKSSRREMPLIHYNSLSKELDQSLLSIGDMNNKYILKKFLKILNRLFNLT